VRTILYRFPDLPQFESLVQALAEPELELGLPAGEQVSDGEWVLAIFELGTARRATSAAARATVTHEGSRLIFEPRDWERLAEFSRFEAKRSSRGLSAPPTSLGSASPVPAARPSDPPQTIRTIPPSGEGAHLLLVDDDPDIRQVVAAMLDSVGLVVSSVETAEEALTEVGTNAFDLLVLDWNLPGMSGVDLCKALRRDPATSHLPILFLTANASSQDMVDAFACGADDYVVKPFRAPELGARIFSLLRRVQR
jgi:two-component system, OmpR family, phosphate regulon response regulator PhoB